MACPIGYPVGWSLGLSHPAIVVCHETSNGISVFCGLIVSHGNSMGSLHSCGSFEGISHDMMHNRPSDVHTTALTPIVRRNIF